MESASTKAEDIAAPYLATPIPTVVKSDASSDGTFGGVSGGGDVGSATFEHRDVLDPGSRAELLGHIKHASVVWVNDYAWTTEQQKVRPPLRITQPLPAADHTTSPLSHRHLTEKLPSQELETILASSLPPRAAVVLYRPPRVVGVWGEASQVKVATSWNPDLPMHILRRDAWPWGSEES